MENYTLQTKVFKALADENRVRIVRLLSQGERCAYQLLEDFDITQPTLSHHMKILTSSGLVDCRKSGKWAYYTINASKVGEVSDFLASLPAQP